MAALSADYIYAKPDRRLSCVTMAALCRPLPYMATGHALIAAAFILRPLWLQVVSEKQGYKHGMHAAAPWLPANQLQPAACSSQTTCMLQSCKQSTSSTSQHHRRPLTLMPKCFCSSHPASSRNWGTASITSLAATIMHPTVTFQLYHLELWDKAVIGTIGCQEEQLLLPIIALIGGVHVAGGGCQQGGPGGIPQQANAVCLQGSWPV